MQDAYSSIVCTNPGAAPARRFRFPWLWRQASRFRNIQRSHRVPLCGRF